MRPLRNRCRLLALDLDGTLLDPEGSMRTPVREAVARARSAGVEVVVCTGRRLRTALPWLEALELEGLAVVQNGVVVKEAASGRTIRSAYLGHELLREALPLVREVSSPLVYLDDAGAEVDFLTERLGEPHPYQREYLADNDHAARELESLDALESSAIVMLSCMAEAAGLLALRPRLEAALGGAIRTNFIQNKNYRGHILETVSAESGKWSALRAVAEGMGIAPDEVVAIGDDENDAEMIAGAGIGIAMGNATASARAAADVIAPDHASDGAAVAIDAVLRGRGDVP